MRVFFVRVAILHNLRPAHPDVTIPDDLFEEFDGADTISAIEAALRLLGVETQPVIADHRMPWRLDEGHFDFVFNLAEGVGRRCREAVPAAVCELLGIPFTGSDALTLAVTLDKAVARRIVSPDVPVARARIVSGEPDELELEDLPYPVLVKPNDEGSSKGIRQGSFCKDAAEAAARCRWLRTYYGCPALVEEFVPGSEVTVAVTGNGASASVLGMMQVAPTEDSDEPFIYSLEVKREWRRRVRYHIPPCLDSATLETIRSYALNAYGLLGCRDVARLDFRLDAQGRPMFLECNPLPGLNPSSSDLVILSSHILPYEKLVQGILLDAGKRLGMSIQ